MQFFSHLFAYDFMRNAFMAGTLAAIISAIVGYFIVLRNQTFAAHALSHIGFAGATGAGLLGLTPTAGQLILTLSAAIGMGNLGEKAIKTDIATGVILSLSLSLGVLFLYFYSNYAGQAMVILFGDLFGVSLSMIKHMFICSTISLFGLVVIGKRLLFSSLEPELAEAKGISLRFISIALLMLVAVAITEASQVVGILLVFTLLVGPAACALCHSRSLWNGLCLSVSIGVITAWLGIISAYISNWPASFWITFFNFITYLFFKNYSLFKKFYKSVYAT